MKLRESTQKAAAGLRFRWSYIILPLAILLLSLAIAVFFYSRLPGEVAYHFKADGAPDRWLRRGLFLLWMLAPQLVLVLMAVALTLGMRQLLKSRAPESTWVIAGKVIAIMGNMLALPQLILCFAMLDVFSYNSYQIRLIPLWLFAVIAVVLGAVVLGVFFTSAIKQSRKAAR